MVPLSVDVDVSDDVVPVIVFIVVEDVLVVDVSDSVGASVEVVNDGVDVTVRMDTVDVEVSVVLERVDADVSVVPDTLVLLRSLKLRYSTSCSLLSTGGRLDFSRCVATSSLTVESCSRGVESC